MRTISFFIKVISILLFFMSLTELCFPKVDTWILNNIEKGILIIIFILSVFLYAFSVFVYKALK